ncbi:hypothetical protein ACFL1X_06330 [Candidatus Hydrogenedentota bacterium]
MLENVVIGPMTEDFILWRCLHGGPLSEQSINELPVKRREAWEKRRTMHIPLLKEIIDTYGTCGILARDGEHVVGSLRFYPKEVCSPGQLCLQGSPTGPSEHVKTKRPLPSLDQIEDKTLMVHCMSTGSPFQENNPYQRKGLGTQMVKELICWAKENGWEAIEANAVEDLSILYEHTGQGGKRFWEKLGFHAVETHTQERGGPVLEKAREQAAARGLDPDVAVTWRMSRDLAE